MHADGKSTLASASKWNSGKVNSMLSLSLTLICSCSCSCSCSWLKLCLVQELTDIEAHGNMSMNVSSPRLYKKANIFLGLIEYELNSLLGASHLVDYISVHIRFDLERYLLNISSSAGEYPFDNSVDLYASRAISIFLLLYKIFLTVCTALSASPFDCAYLGLLGGI